MTTAGVQLVDFCLPTKGLRTLVHPGYEFPLHATVVGKAVYTFQPEEVIKHELSKNPERFMPNTIVGKRAIRSELAQVKIRGYAINDAELDPGVYAIAVPIKITEDTAIGALAIVGIRDRMLKNHSEKDIASNLKKHAKELSRYISRKHTRLD